MAIIDGYPATSFDKKDREWIKAVADGILPDATEANAGDVLTVNEDGEAEWKPPSGENGLEWEEGEWTPTTDVASEWINLSKTHTKPPAMFSIISTKNTYDSTTSTVYSTRYINFEAMGLDGWASVSDDSAHIYGIANYANRSTGSNIAVNLGTSIKHPLSSTTDNDAEYPRYWAQENKIRASTNSASRYFRANIKFKWIAIWYPTSESEEI